MNAKDNGVRAMKLAMRLPERTAAGAANDTDPRETATTMLAKL